MPKQSLLALMNPRDRMSATAFNTPEPDWSDDASAMPVTPDEMGTGEALQAAPTPQLPASMQGLQSAATDPLSLDAKAPGGYVQGRVALQDQADEEAQHAKLAAEFPHTYVAGHGDSQQSLDESPMMGLEAQKSDQKALTQYHDLAQFFSPEQAQERGVEQKAKLELATAPTIAAGKNQIDVERMKLEGEKYKADQALAGKNASAAAAASTKFPAQIQAQAINAGATADHLDALSQTVDDPDLQAVIGPLAGRWSDFMQGKIGANELGVSDPTVARKIGQLRMNMTLAASGVARAHNQRGATKELLEQFEKELNAARSPELLHGAIDAAKSMMLVYAHPSAFSPAGSPGAPPADPMNKVLGPPAPARKRYDFSGNPIQ